MESLNCFIAVVIFCALSHLIDGKHTYTKQMDEGIHYSQIVPFGDEWLRTFGQTEYKEAPAPVNFWLKCVDKELRGYFHVEDLRKRPGHGKEADMPIAYKFRDNVKLYFGASVNDANGLKQVPYGIWMGGGDFKVDISGIPSNGTAHIFINDWMHYTLFPLSDCTKLKPQGPETKYVMNLYTRYFDNPHSLNKKAADGIAKHYLYHRCALRLSHYEINVQKEQVQYFMKHPVLAEAARAGFITFIIKNSAIPGPIRGAGGPHGGSNCYWQQVSQNLGILRRWKQNVRIYLWDGDEYMMYHPSFTKEDFNRYVTTYPILAFERYMGFCFDCPKDEGGELNYLNFNERNYKKSWRLNDPKLLVDPSHAGAQRSIVM